MAFEQGLDVSVNIMPTFITWRTNFSGRANNQGQLWKQRYAFYFFKDQKGGKCGFSRLRKEKNWVENENREKTVGEGWGGKRIIRVLQAYHCKLTGFYFAVMKNHWRASSRRAIWCTLCSEGMTLASVLGTHCSEHRSETLWGPEAERTVVQPVTATGWWEPTGMFILFWNWRRDSLPNSV